MLTRIRQLVDIAAMQVLHSHMILIIFKRRLVQALYETIVLGAFFQDRCCGGQGRVRTVSQDSDVLLELLDLGLEDGHLGALRLSLLDQVLHALVENLVFVPLCLDVCLQLLVVFTRSLMQLILHNFGLFNEHVHHNVYLFTNLVSLLFEHLQQVIARYQLILKIN